MVTLLAKGQQYAAGGTVTSTTSGLGSPQIGNPEVLSVGVYASAATEVTIQISYDGVHWLPAFFRNTNIPAQAAIPGAGGAAFDVTPAPYIQVTTSNQVNLYAWAYSA